MYVYSVCIYIYIYTYADLREGGDVADVARLPGHVADEAARGEDVPPPADGGRDADAHEAAVHRGAY